LKTYRQFLDFVSNNYKNFLFVAVFFSLWLVYKYALAFDPELFSFPGRMIGEATLSSYDINKRISVFYTAGLIFFFSIVAFSFLSWRLSLFSNRLLKSAEMQLVNYTSLAGITFYFFDLWTHSFYSSFELIYCLHKIAIAGILVKWLIFKNKPVDQLLNSTFYGIAAVLGVSLFFLLNEIAVLFQLFPKVDLFVTLFVFVLLALISISFLLKNKTLSEAKIWLNRTAFVFLPLALIPIGSFLKDEIYLIMNRHQVDTYTPAILYTFFILCLALITFWRWKRLVKKDRLINKNNEQLLALRYFPLFVVSLATYTFYNPFIDLSNEMFEAGNRFLPVMEFQKYGVIPVFEKFNAHVLSELFFGSIYAFFNGLHSREMYIYDFIYQVFWAFMVYRFVYGISRNAYISLFSIFLFPLVNALLFDYTIISLLAVFVLDKVVHERASFKNYFLLILLIAFLILWRIDIGYPAAIASLIVLLVYYINRVQFKISWILMFKSLGLFLGITLLGLLLIGWCRGVNVFEKLWSGLNYLASGQTYGVSSLGDVTKAAFKIQYFVFPLTMILIVGAMLTFYKKYNVSRPQRVIYLSFLFLIIYYFMNFQRGLVRHSFVEGHDNGVSSFAFFILSGSVFLFFRNRSILFRFISFLLISTFLIMNYKLPVPTDFRNLFSKTIEKTETFSAITPRPDIVRCIDTTDYEEKNFGKFKKMVSSCLSEKQTFIDFSNLPMLYYFTGKKSPSYFYQNPLTIHNDYLQKSFLSGLKDYDAPLIVFSNFPENWWDNVDGVSNTMRHYRLAEHFYQYYSPFAIVDKLCIWKRNDFDVENTQRTIFSYSREMDSVKTDVVRFKIKLNEEIPRLLKISFNTNAPEISLISSTGNRFVKADFINETTHTAYYILEDESADFTIELLNNENLITAQLKESKYVPDFYSATPQRDDLLLLPFIWANYDKTISTEKVIQDLSLSALPLEKNNIHYYGLNPSVDKKTGNTVFISLETENEEPLFVDLAFGNKKEGNKGAFVFKITPGKGIRNYAVRLSTHYNWYDSTIDYVAVNTWMNNNILVKRIELLKGE